MRVKWVCAAVAAVVLATSLGACDKQAARPFSFGKTTTVPKVADRGAVLTRPVQPCETRPEWWHDTPRKLGADLSVCAGSEDRDLLVARRRAVEAATRRFEAAAGGPPVEPEMQADSVRLNDGTFRAFVRLWARMP